MTKVSTSIGMVWVALVSRVHLWCLAGGVDILRPLAVSVQKHHGATGPDHEATEHGITDGPQGARAISRT